jgi:predicted nucleotide-binding protein (sugar kinase/HSP70/actin superfamily)
LIDSDFRKREGMDSTAFNRLGESVQQFDVSGRRLLVPDMSPTGSRLIAASFRAVGADAVVMETYKGLALGREYTSGKECFPCQVTLGDILHHLEGERRRLGEDFDPKRYVYFLPEADGPCRFGMYNKLQRLVLDRFDSYRGVPIVYISTKNNYATADIVPPGRSSYFRKLSYVAVIIADVLDRMTCRVRPYEREPGSTDAFMGGALDSMVKATESMGPELDFGRLLGRLADIAVDARSLMKPGERRRPRIGIIGEIYLRTHPHSNQDIIRKLEAYGGEVVNASLGEWINFVNYESIRKAEHQWRKAWRERSHGGLRQVFKQWLGLKIEQYYQRWRQGQVYRAVLEHLDIEPDHSIETVQRRLDRNSLFHFAIGTEAVLSIGGALEYVHHGFDGVVNVFPFTCMPSTIASSVLRPMLHEMKIPYLDAPYDGAIQPNREAALRTFLYQAKQHRDSNGTGKE